MDATLSAPIGQLLDGRYLVESQIARGGMATVYLARDVRLERTVALKIAHPELARDSEFVDRFIGEARAVARLSSPNVVAVFDQGSTGDLHYIAMEHVPGPTLRQLLNARGRLDPDEALAIIERVLTGLAAAHDAGIIHRDVKPENVLLGNGTSVKVADFGLARAAAGIRHTRTGLLIGTAAYLAPEQVISNSSDERTDVYAAGVMLFEMLTGRQPHTGESPLAVAYKHVNSVVPPPSDDNPDLPPALDALVAAATSRDPDQRPADARQYLRAVADVRRSVRLPASNGARAPGAPGAPGADGATGANGAAGQPPAPDGVTARYAADGQPRQPGHHTMIFSPAEQPDFGAGPHRDRRHQHGRGYREPWLQRWLFSRRILAVPVAALVAVGVWWLAAGQYSTVPVVRGMTVAAARGNLKGAGFTVVLGAARNSNTIPAGDVIATSPRAGTRARHGSKITVTRSLGPVLVTMPSVTGMTLAEAQKALHAAGLQQSAPVDQTSASIPAGIVISTRPVAYTHWPKDKPVQLVVSSGPPLPNFVGQQIATVQAAAAAGGYNINQVPVTSATQPAGTVISQSPAPNTPITAGEVVTVQVSQGNGQTGAMVPVPNVQGYSESQAISTLQAAGFQVQVSKGLFGSSVTGYSPTGQAPQGSTITIDIGYL